MTTAEILPQIFQLSSQDQVMIVEAIRNHLVGGLAPVDEEEFKRELERRMAEDPAGDLSLEEMKRRLQKRR